MPHIYAGAGIALDYHINIKTIGDTIGLQKFTGYNYGTMQGQNSFSSGLTFNLLYDSRTNTTNPASGTYANITVRNNRQIFGSNSNWNSLILDLRRYYSMNKTRQDVIAVWAYYWTVLNNDVPYLDLPSIGWDSYQRSGRGFDQNRYRGKGLIDLEAEYRRDITADGLFGFVAFANMNSVTEQNGYNFAYLHPAVGCGVRIKFNKLSRTNVAIDYATSKGFSSFYINLGEVF
jgi:outer membrane protein assembly factor BamA